MTEANKHPQVEFHFDFGSPNAYLAHRVIPDVEQRTGVKFAYIPVLIGGVFKATNNVSPMVALKGVLNKSEYQQLETRRFLARHGITDFRMNPHFPINTLQLMRGAIVAQQLGIGPAYIDAVFHAIWVDEKNMGDTEIVAEVLGNTSIPAEDILKGSADPDVKQRLISNTEASVRRGNFGSPTFFVGDEMYFGKDRLGDVEDEIRKQLAF